MRRKIRILIFICILGLSQPVKAASLEECDKSETVSVTISAAGDCTLGIDPTIHHTFDYYYKKNGSAYFLKKVKKVFAKDDITIVNFEGTLTNSANRAPRTYAFKGPAEYAKILKKGSVEVVNLANNHSMDYGKSAFTDTTKTLKKNKNPLLLLWYDCL